MTPHVSFGGLVVVAALAFVVPLIVASRPARRVPAVVLLIVSGIVVGPSGLGIVSLDLPIQILALIGLAFLLFLAGLEVEVHEMRGRRLQLAVASFGLSFALALAIGAGLGAIGLVDAPVLVAVILVGTSLGVVIPVLKDAGEIDGDFGQLVVAAASVADVGAIVLLSVLFTRDGDPAAAALLFALFAVLAVVLVVAILRAEQAGILAPVLRRLQDTTAQIRVRAAWLLLVGIAAVAETLGLEVILGAFVAGAILTVVDTDTTRTHPLFRPKLEAIGFGVFVPVFFITTGLRFDLEALLAGPEALALVPVFVAALLLARGVPAIVLGRSAGPRRLAAAGLLQATLLPIAPAQIGLELGLLNPATSSALITAGLIAVVVFPSAALALLGPRPAESSPPNQPTRTMEHARS